MSVVYLDLEGVVVSHRSILAASNIQRYSAICAATFMVGVDQTSLNLIAFMAKKHNSKICITSTLRDYDYLKPTLEAAFKDAGFIDMLHGDWRTCHEEDTREKQIQSHIRRNAVDRYIVLDDRKLEIKNFVRVDPTEGFTFRNYLDAQLSIAMRPNEIAIEHIYL